MTVHVVLAVLVALCCGEASTGDVVLPPSSSFSGFYSPDISSNMEPFASAWLTSREKFIKSAKGFASMKNFEGTVFSVIGPRRRTKRIAIMSRDYFDFHVEHLSSTTNTLEGSELYDIIGKRLSKRADALRHFCQYNKSDVLPYRTLAIIPFSSLGAHSSDNDMKQLRILMFTVTFWSLKRYNLDVVVSVSIKDDEVILRSLNLPLFHIYTFFNISKKSEQPKRSLLQAVKDIQALRNWRQFEFVYYSDADQILHMRRFRNIYETLKMRKTLVLCPHRFQTMTLPKDLPIRYRQKKHFSLTNILQYTQKSSLIQESGQVARGSCCDDGRYVIANRSICDNFWYYCDKLHTFTLANWIKFGRNGLTSPLTTEHLGKCRYFSTPAKCDSPKPCQGLAMVASDSSRICDEVKHVHYF